MLELKNITKVYPTGGEDVHALKGIDLTFRKNEFVAILGPSGCGKTTMLNIIGGLDRYTTGDLLINGRSTRDYNDRDWDTYRNHSVGFVFQTYNLIPHQSVLSNVDLALTLSGVKRAERRRRAKDVLDAVGLSSQIRKRPGLMSGGQMQRVAIARALVNQPDIILADEPTGALDTETSLQVMELLKEAAKDHLVIMVTHNPDLANRYATRIITMLDGVITGDSNPLHPEEIWKATAEAMAQEKSPRRKKRERKPSMSFWTSFSLSLRNLFTKRGRTLLTAFAGSIGIIGIALIFAVSHGMTEYINDVQEETLSSYPITLESTNLDLGSLLSVFMASASSDSEHENDAVYEKTMVYDMLNAVSNLEETENDLRSFRVYLDGRVDAGGEDSLRNALTGVQYIYDLDLQIFTENVDGDIIRSDTRTIMEDLMREYVGMNYTPGTSSSSGSSNTSFISLLTPGSTYSSQRLWSELIPGLDGEPVNELYYDQYELVTGTWPEAYDEVVLVLDENNELQDIVLYALGLLPQEVMDNLMQAAADGTEVEPYSEHWSYEDVMNRNFRVVLNADCYTEDVVTGLYTDLRDTDAGIKYLYSKGTPLKVTGIIKPAEGAISSIIQGSVAYTYKLAEHIISESRASESINAQLKDPDTDIFTGLPFQSTTEDMTDREKKDAFLEYIDSLDYAGKADVYVRIMSIPPEDYLEETVTSMLGDMTREDMQNTLLSALTAEMGMDEKTVGEYLDDMEDEEIEDLFRQAASMQVSEQYAASVRAQLSMMGPEQLAAALDLAMEDYSNSDFAGYYDDILEFSDSDYEGNLSKLGYIDLSDPTAINLFASTFENKDVIEDAIAEYNKGVDELHQISYTDYVGIIMSSVTTIINAITYVLIAFVAISLIVSSIMIGVITFISVQERTKEIGILRSIGASKRNVSRLFNAETVIVGFFAGLLGVGITYLLLIPINSLLHNLTNISSLNAILPPQVGAVLVGISVLLTLFAGIIPSRSAAKKDPVVALRTE